MSLFPLTRQTFVGALSALMLFVSVASFFTDLFGEKASIGLGTLFLVASLILFYHALKPKKKDPGTITAEQAAARLKGQYSFNRVEGISKLYPDLGVQLSGEEVAIILGNLFAHDRVEALKILKPKIRRNLSPEELDYILGPLHTFNKNDATAVLASKEEGAKRVSKSSRR